MSNVLLLIGLALVLLVSGCTATPTDNGVGAPTDNTQITEQETIENDTTEEEIFPEPGVEEDATNEEEDAESQDNVPPVPPTEIQEPVDKLEPPYTCGDRLLLQVFKDIYGSDTDILRKPPPFGKTINYSSCNVKTGGTVILQMEFHETVTLEAALESMEDEARQIESQLFESVKTVETIGNKGYSFASERTGEYRYVYVDDDPETPVFVIIRSLPGSDLSADRVRQAAQILEKII